MGKLQLQKFMIEDHIKSALREDIGFGDITSDLICEDYDILEAKLNTRQDGILCGAQVFKAVFEILDPSICVEFYKNDGNEIIKNETVARICGSARSILSGERLALNYIQRLSGIATETKKYQDAIAPFKAKIVDTRKTTPNFRIFEKYAVQTGGGGLHRFNLSDCAMLKDNHIKLAGSIQKAVEKLRKNMSFTHKIEVECDTFEQVKEAVEAEVEIIMLDNMDYEQMRKCVKYIAKRAIVEASGNVKLGTVNEIASCGVDIISSSAIVAGAKTLDLGLDI